MELNIRAAEQGDEHMLADLGAKTFYDTFRPFNAEEDMQAYLKKAYTLELIKTNLLNPEINYFILLDNRKPAGYIKLIQNATYEGLSGKTIELEKIYVLKDYFGSEAGNMLMKEAINFARSNQFTTLFLGVWEENHRAVAFYKKHGFQVFASRNFQLGSRICADYMMKLPL